MGYNFKDNEVNQAGYIFKTGRELSSLQRHKAEINDNIFV